MVQATATAAEAASNQTETDFITKYIFAFFSYLYSLLIVLYEYFSVFFSVFQAILIQIKNIIWTILTEIYNKVYVIFKFLYDIFIYPIFYPIYKLIRPIIKTFFENIKKIIVDFVTPFLENQIYWYILGFFIYIIGVVYFNSDKTQATKSFTNDNPYSFFNYLNPLNWIRSIGKFFYIFIFTIMFLFYSFFYTFSSSDTYSDLYNNFDKALRNIVIYIAASLSIIAFIYMIGDQNTLKNMKFKTTFIILFCIFFFFGMFFDKVVEIFFNTGGNFFVLIQNFFSRGELFPKDEPNPLNNKITEIMDDINKVFLPITSFIEDLFKKLNQNFSIITTMDIPHIMYVITSFILLLIYLFYSFIHPEHTFNLYLFVFFLFIFFISPIFYRLNSNPFDIVKSVIVLGLGIVSMFTMYVTQTSMGKNTVYQSTPEQHSDKTIFNILFLVYSAIIVFFINIQLLSQNYNPQKLSLYILVHAIFIIFLVYYSTSYKMKLRNRILKSADTTADMSSTEHTTAEVAALGAATGMDAPPAAPPLKTIVPNDNISPHEQMYRI